MEKIIENIGKGETVRLLNAILDNVVHYHSQEGNKDLWQKYQLLRELEQVVWDSPVDEPKPKGR